MCVCVGGTRPFAATTMSSSTFHVDSTSVVLIGLLAVLLLYAKFHRQYNQPLLHPLILQRQSDASAVRMPKESPSYRNVNAPLGLDLAMRPHRNAPTIATMLARGVDEGTSALTRRVLDASLSNEEIRTQAALFLSGVQVMLQTDRPTIVVCGFINSSRSLTALLASALVGSQSNYGGGTQTYVVPPGEPPSSMPSDVDLSKTAVVCLDAPLLPMLTRAGLVIANENSDLQGTKCVGWDDVLGQATVDQAPPVVDTTRLSNAELDRLGTSVFASFWDARNAWVQVTETSMTSGVTAWLSQFPVDAIPQKGDVMFTDLMYARAVPAPVYVTLLLAGLYTGAGLAMEPSVELVSTIKTLHPTLLYVGTSGAQYLEQSVWMPSVGSLLWPLMRRMNMDLIRNGIFPKDKLLDKLVCKRVRDTLGMDQVRATIVAGDGSAAEQSLVDSLRLYLGVPVMHSYVPQRMECHHQPSLVTAPVCTSNLYDLQAFAPQLVHDDSARCLPAHVGPPSVSLEIKLVDDTPAVRAHSSVIQRLREDGNHDDPIGEVYVRGYTVSQTGHDDTNISPWHATGDVALVRTNGTFVVIAPHGAKEAGVMPNTMTSTEASNLLAQRFRDNASSGMPPRRTSGARIASSAPAMLAMLLFLVGCVDARHMMIMAPLHHEPRMHMLSRRAKDDTDPKTNTTMVNLAFQGIMAMQRASWEHGVLQSAMIEYSYPQWSMFKRSDHGDLFPPAKSVPSDQVPNDLIKLAQSSVDGQDRQGRLATVITGDEDMDQGASMDSASCGEGVLLAAWVYEGFPNQAPDSHGYYGPAAAKQLRYLLKNVTRTPTGAISQRASPKQVQLWSDSAYMGPPFLAYYGWVTQNQSLVQMAFDELKLQRSALHRPQDPGRHLWRHIIEFPNNTKATRAIDARVWLTGNGWAAAGMLRVAAIISHSPWADKMQAQHDQLVQWADDIITAAYQFVDPGTGLLLNAIDDPSTFLDGSGSALLSYAVFRLASMDQGRKKHVDMAEKAYQTLSKSLNSLSQFTNGIQTVNEMQSNEAGATSTESLAFLILMAAARRDYHANNVTGSTGPLNVSDKSSSAWPSHDLPSISWFSAAILTLIGLVNALSI